jgi:YggT family protein
MILVIRIIQYISQILIILVIADVVLSYFMSPFHPIRLFISRIVSPMLSPIRRIIPPIQMIDLSPLVLIILIQVITSLLVRFLITLR